MEGEGGMVWPGGMKDGEGEMVAGVVTKLRVAESARWRMVFRRRVLAALPVKA